MILGFKRQKAVTAVPTELNYGQFLVDTITLYFGKMSLCRLTPQRSWMQIRLLMVMRWSIDFILPHLPPTTAPSHARYHPHRNEPPNPRRDKSYEYHTDKESSNDQGDIYWHWVSLEWSMSERVQSVLRKIPQSRDTNFGSVDSTKGCKAKDLCRVVTNCQLVWLRYMEQGRL